MFLYITLGSNDLARAKRFYDPVMATLGANLRAGKPVVALPLGADETVVALNTAPTLRDEPCFWLYSSGSTGSPKGTVHLHSHLIATAQLYAGPVLGILTALVARGDV